MNKKHVSNTVLFCLIGFSLVLSACSGSPFAKKTRSGRDVAGLDGVQNGVWRPSLKDDFPSANNDAVQKWVGLFQGRFKPNFDRWFARLGKYGPTIEAVLKSEGVPKDLIYLAMIESGFNMQARSHASAVGPWQFIRSTGKMYGLHNDFFMDDRSDIVKATRAAARHLKDLYRTYGDWYLAFAAYNAGPGTVNGAIKRTGSNDYWVHAKSRSYRQETKDYVPKILAARHIVKNYPKYGYSARSFALPLQYDRVTVPDATDLPTIAKAANANIDVIKELNPQLVSGITRPGEEANVYIPKGAKALFERRYSTLPTDERVSGLYHRAGRHETIASVARRYGIHKTRVSRLNNMNPDAPLTPGQVVRIPGEPKLLTAALNGSYRGSTDAGSGSWTTHRVRRGETLSRIASRYRTSVRQLAGWNRISTRSKLRVGQNLKVQTRGAARKNVASHGSLFYAANPNMVFNGAPRGRMSGVAHIIAKDRDEPADLTLSREEAGAFMPAMAAMYSGIETLGDSADAPSVIKTIDMGVDEDGAVEAISAGVIAHANGQTKPVTKTITAKAPTKLTVQKGDSLYTIASRYDVSVNELKEANGLTENRIDVNQALTIPTGYVQKGKYQVPVTAPIAKPVAAKPVLRNRTASAPAKVIVHNTRSGDTLWKISKRYGVKITDIKRWNGLRGDSLRPNQKIKIQANAGKRVAAKT